MKRISRNLTAAALASSLALAGATAANAEENNTTNPDSVTNTATNTDGDNAKDGGTKDEGAGDGTKNDGTKDEGAGDGTENDGTKDEGADDDKNPGQTNPDENKEKSSFDDFKAKLSSEEGKPTDLGIAAIVVGVLGALAAVVPAAAQALGIKLPF